MSDKFDIVILGLSITSSWGNGHATTWRSLVKGLSFRGHRILFLERNAPWYAANRDDAQPEGTTTIIYNDLDELFLEYEEAVSQAFLVLVGSYVPDGVKVGEWVTSVAHGRTAFYDIDTPVTMATLKLRQSTYISPELIRKYNAYLSFTGGPTLRLLESKYGSPMARALYCSVDEATYAPQDTAIQCDLGYLGTYSSDRQPSLNSLLLQTAVSWPSDRFVVAGPQYPAQLEWPHNVHRIEHLPPSEHPGFYSAQRFTLNITRAAMREAGYSPSVRLFEAAACGTPIISDWWEGLDTLFRPGNEVLVANSQEDVSRYLHDLSESERLSIAEAARLRVLREHTSAARAAQLDMYLKEMNDYVSPDQARGHRCIGKSAGGMATGLGTEPEGSSRSEEAGGVAVEAAS